MRSVPVPGPGLFVPADIAAAIAPTLARALSDARRLGIYPDPEVAETIERLAVIGSAWAVRHDGGVAQDVPMVDTHRSGDVKSITVQQAAELLHVSDSAVKARLRRGTLRGVKSGRAWRVDAEAVRREAACR